MHKYIYLDSFFKILVNLKFIIILKTNYSFFYINYLLTVLIH